MLRLIARILETLLMVIDPESGHRLIDSRKPPKPKKQPMSDKRFERIMDLLEIILIPLVVGSPMLIMFILVIVK